MPHRLFLAALCVAFISIPAMAETGGASWYGPGFHGRKTANGERYNQNAVSCAHKKIRLGSVIRVTDTRSGKSVVCRVNDRGPYIKGRIVDLSKAAAIRLGMIKRGTARVRLEILKGASRR